MRISLLLEKKLTGTAQLRNLSGKEDTIVKKKYRLQGNSEIIKSLK